MAVIDKKASGPKIDDPEPKDEIVCKDSDKSKKAATPKETTVSILQLYSFADGVDYVLMLIGAIGAAGHGLAMPVTLIFFGELINGIGSLSEQTVNKYALLYVWMSILAFGSSWLEIAFWMHTGHRQAAKLRAKYLEALLRQDVSYFDTGTNTGDIVNSIATDTLAVQDAIGEKTGHFLHHLATFIGSFIISFNMQWRLAVVTIAVIPCIALSGALYTYYLARFSVETSSASSGAEVIAHQTISQIRTVYSFVAEENFLKSYSESLQNALRLRIFTGLVTGVGKGVTLCIIFCSYGLLFTYGGILVRHGYVSGGGALSTIFIVVVGSMSLGQALSSIPTFTKGQASAFKILQVIRNKPSINKPDESALMPATVEGRLELWKVDFYYPSRPDVPILRDFSLTIPPGQTVAVVGSSGSGKSTVVSLIERFYDPTAGEVLLDGLDLKNLNLKWLRQQIGLVSQEPALFAATIAGNIVYGSANANQQEIEAAAKVANAHSFISQLPQGYETQVGERGVQLSGGQRQRIAIARAIVRNPRILLLDEATSALDTESEHVVQEALDRIMVERTTVMIAHRLTTIRNADIIAVVEQGRIVERGSHQELISREGGVYAAAILLQELAANKVVTSRNLHPLQGSSHPDIPNSTAHSRHISSIPNGAEGGEATLQAEQQEKEAVKGWKGPVIRLAAMTKKDWMYTIAAMIGSTGTGLLTLANSIILASLLSEYYNPNQQKMKKNLSNFSLLSVALGVAAIFIYIIQDYSLGVLGERLVARVREMMFAGILKNELGWFDEDDNNSDRLAGRLSSDAEGVRSALGDRIAVLFTSITILIASFAVSFAIQWRLTLLFLGVFPLINIASVFETWVLTKFTKGQAKAYERATQVAGEAVGNFRTVAAFSAEDKVQVRFTNELEGPQQQSFRKGHIVGFGYGLSQFFFFCSLAIAMWYSQKLVASRKATLASVMKVFLILVMGAQKAVEALTLAPDLVKGVQAVGSLFELIDRRTKIEPNDPEGVKAESVHGDIELKQVTFAYPSRRDIIVLKNMNVKLEAGHSLALVGSSGSGKSSIIALMERFYDPVSGQVLIDGKDIKRYNLQSIRKHIALVQQEPALFATTIYENIEYGKPGVTEAEVIQAAKAANAHNFISSLPEGYRTLVGERGVQLSGGQKQRVAIARAVLKDPTIFLLDEATSALDAESEKVVQAAIDRLMNGRTTVMVAHRLSTIRGADTIAVVQDGVVIEQGSHAALRGQDGAYSRLIRIQDPGAPLVV